MDVAGLLAKWIGWLFWLIWTVFMSRLSKENNLNRKANLAQWFNIRRTKAEGKLLILLQA